MEVVVSHVVVVGLGNMGGGLAARLAGRGIPTVGVDLDASARERAQSEGVSVTASLQEAVPGARAVLTSLPNGPIVHAVWMTPGGLIDLSDVSTILIEMSTVDPQTMTTVASAAAAKGVSTLDCPVSGGPNEARAGTLSLLVGGSDDVIADVEEILDCLGTRHHVGAVGDGKVVKIVNNMMSMGNIVIAAEAFAIGRAAGVDPQRLFDVLSVSGGTSNQFRKRFPRVLAGDFEPGFTVELAEKDMSLAQDLARSMGIPAPAASTVHDMYAVAMAEGLTAKDHVAVLRLYESWSEGRGATSRPSAG